MEKNESENKGSCIGSIFTLVFMLVIGAIILTAIQFSITDWQCRGYGYARATISGQYFYCQLPYPDGKLVLLSEATRRQ